MALLTTDGAAAALASAALRLGCAAAVAAARKDVGRCVRRTPQLAMVNMSKPLLSSRPEFVDIPGPRLTRIPSRPQAIF